MNTSASTTRPKFFCDLNHSVGYESSETSEDSIDNQKIIKKTKPIFSTIKASLDNQNLCKKTQVVKKAPEDKITATTKKLSSRITGKTSKSMRELPSRNTENTALKPSDKYQQPLEKAKPLKDFPKKSKTFYSIQQFKHEESPEAEKKIRSKKRKRTEKTPQATIDSKKTNDHETTNSIKVGSGISLKPAAKRQKTSEEERPLESVGAPTRKSLSDTFKGSKKFKNIDQLLKIRKKHRKRQAAKKNGGQKTTPASTEVVSAEVKIPAFAIKLFYPEKK